MVNCPGYDEQQSLGEGGGVGTPQHTHTHTHTHTYVIRSWLMLMRPWSQQAKGHQYFKNCNLIRQFKKFTEHMFSTENLENTEILRKETKAL